MLNRLKSVLPEYGFEYVTTKNLSLFESVFYSNPEYYILTDSHPATKKDCIDTINFEIPERVRSIGVTREDDAVAFVSVIEGYPVAETYYIGLLLVDERYKRQHIGSQIVRAMITVASGMGFKNVCLSVQDNNVVGTQFWKKLGFYETGRCKGTGFDNLSLRYDI